MYFKVKSERSPNIRKHKERECVKKQVKSALCGHSGPNELEMNDSCDSKCEMAEREYVISEVSERKSASFLKTHAFRKLPLQSPTVEFDTSVKNMGRNTHTANTAVVL